jgi:hypothetical protein
LTAHEGPSLGCGDHRGNSHSYCYEPNIENRLGSSAPRSISWGLPTCSRPILNISCSCWSVSAFKSGLTTAIGSSALAGTPSASNIKSALKATKPHFFLDTDREHPCGQSGLHSAELTTGSIQRSHVVRKPESRDPMAAFISSVEYQRCSVPRGPRRSFGLSAGSYRNQC